MESASAAAPAGTARRQLLRNAFQGRFLNLIDERDDPDSAVEADLDGPWTVVPHSWQGAPGFGVFRGWEDPQRDEPRGWFRSRELALVAAALLPASGKEDWFELSTAVTGAGHRLEQRGKLVGFLPLYEEKVAVGLHFAECLIRSPAALANLLMAVSPLALKLIGTVLARSLDPLAEEGEDWGREQEAEGQGGEPGGAEPELQGEGGEGGGREPVRQSEGREGGGRAPEPRGEEGEGEGREVVPQGQDGEAGRRVP